VIAVTKILFARRDTHRLQKIAEHRDGAPIGEVFVCAINVG